MSEYERGRRDGIEQSAQTADKMKQAAGEVLQKGHDDDAAVQYDTASEIVEAIRALAQPSGAQGLWEAARDTIATMEKLLRRYTANDHAHGGCDELTEEAEAFLEAMDIARLAAAQTEKEKK